ncbi:Bacteriophage replication gene A protein (GPA) [Onishia taeanensis]|uniref:Bacteriophage replication gene A protein (GPA) n=1 Tax=Onishia taeanensis TaxID=284577 RepID=A0A1G7SHG2_9GAMM|nr:replication endonuclease [Halomonas taeanensis]SDG21849.1 Bacteriophage replication gene A protein (GPA) [Halomonas taeanensis]
MTSALDQSRQFGTRECHQWRDEQFFAPLPSLAEDLARAFITTARRHGNAAGNRWLARNAAELVEPSRVYRRFAPMAKDLKRAVMRISNAEPTLIEGHQAASRWLEDVSERLMAGPWNTTHDDEALVNYAKAQAKAVEDERNRLAGDMNRYNRALRLGLFSDDDAAPVASQGPLSKRAGHWATARAQARNAMSPAVTIASPLAELTFQRMRPMTLRIADELALKKAREKAAKHGIEPPNRNSASAFQLARLSSSRWWRRKLRRLSGRRIEQVQREGHRVHAQAGIYCSEMTLERRREQKTRNRALLETIEAINQEGQRYTLAELSELGLANADHRRAELMLRIRDTEVEARRLGHQGMFYTLTTPSRFHPVKSKSCRRNPKYDGATPRDAQQHLQALWAKARAKLARDGHSVYGIRVVEPHHDGTPHWHLLVWMEPHAEPHVTEVLRSYAEEESPEELADRRGRKTTARFKPVKIDPTRGSAAGYIAKYISKNINGQQFMEADRYDHSMATSAPRIEAWAAVWGVRQFQFVGLPSVTVWREIRRLTEKQEAELRQWEEATRPHPKASETLHLIRRAANAGQWDLFLRLMGGPNTPRKEQPIKPWIVQRVDTSRDDTSHATGEVQPEGWAEVKGRYGEPVSATWGLVVNDGRGGAEEYLTRVYRWTIQPIQRSQAEGSPGGREAGDAWTCVTNCTGVDSTPRNPPPAELAEQMKRFQAWRSSEEVRAEQEAAEIEGQSARATIGRMIQHDASAREILAARGIHIAPPSTEPEEFFPDELC